MSRLNIAEGEFSVHEAGGTLYASWRCKDPRTWEQIKLSFRASFPHWTGVSYDGGWRAWKVPLHQRQRLAEWADAWFRDEAQQWDGERHSNGSRQQRAREREAAPLSSLSQAYAILHVAADAPPELLTAAHRIALRAAHPDTPTGSHEKAVAVNRAWELIQAAQSRRSGAA